MSLFRSKKDLDFAKKLNKELVERIISEKITYYAMSKKLTSKNLYGESKQKVYDPPIEIYSLIKWGDQEITTTKYGQDIVYGITFYPLIETLKKLNVTPREGDIIEYDSKKFEITKISVPQQMMGKEEQNFYFRIECTTARNSMFFTHLSGTPEDADRTRPDNNLSATFSYSDVTFAYSGSV